MDCTADMSRDKCAKPSEKGRAGRSTPDSGFSLVEILIVVVILGILGSVTVLALKNTVDRGTSEACKVDAETLNEAIDLYHASGHTDPVTIDALVETEFIAKPSGLHVITDGALVPTGECT